MVDEAFDVELPEDYRLSGAIKAKKATVFVDFTLQGLLLRWVHAAIGFLDESVSEHKPVIAGQHR